MRVAAFQVQPVLDDAPAAAAVVAENVSRAAAAGAARAVFPEAYLLGHSYDRETIAARARTLDDPEVQRLAESLRSLPVTVVAGLFARRGNSVRNAALVLHAGALAGTYAKAHPNEPGVAAGTRLPVFQAGGSRFAVNICNDANDPARAQRARRGGARVLCCPLNNMLRRATAERWRERSAGNLVARARQTGCWVVSSDVAGTCGAQVCFGCTAVASPAGEIAARVAEGETGRIIVDARVTG